MASYAERVNLNFDILHKDFDAILRKIKILNLASLFENPQIWHKLAYQIE